MSQFAANTEVSVEKSKAEIEKMLTRYVATKYASGWDDNGATIMFVAKERHVRFVLPLPTRSDRKFLINGNGQRRNAEGIEKAHEQACRQRWRALCLVIKAKLEAVESGISNFEMEFLAHIALPGGATVGEVLAPQLADAYTTGKMPPLLGTGT